jgi:hypothetical protein
LVSNFLFIAGEDESVTTLHHCNRLPNPDYDRSVEPTKGISLETYKFKNKPAAIIKCILSKPMVTKQK